MSSVALRRRLPAMLLHNSGVMAPLAFLVVVIGFLAITSYQDGFLSPENWNNIIQSITVVAILALGETAVIILGGIDLSVGRVLALSAVVGATVVVNYHASVFVGVLACCLTGLVCGTITGLLTVYGRMPSFVASLGMTGIANGLALRIAGGQNISGLPDGFAAFSRGVIPFVNVPVPLAIMLLIFFISHLALSVSQWGRGIYAVGGNRQAAHLSGISVPRTTVSVFMLSGLLAGVAAVMHVSRTNGAQPTAGANMELNAIAATVIGGTSLSGGVGGVVGTLIGAFLLAVIQNGCDLKNQPLEAQIIITGGVIWLASIYDGLRQRPRA